MLQILKSLSVYNLIFFSLIGSAKDDCIHTIKGFVIDGESKHKFSGVSIVINNGEKSTLSDANGFFEIKNLCHGNVEIKLSFIGYKPIVKKYEIEQDIEENFTLHSDTCELASINIFSEINKESISQPQTVLSGKELAQLRGLGLAETLKEVPGMGSFQSGPNIAKPMLHGMQGNRLVLINNGVKLESQQWGNDHAPEIDPFISNKITIIKGASGLRYGAEAMAGAIVLDARDLHYNSKLNGEINLMGASNNRLGVVSAILEGSPKFAPFLCARVQGTFRKAGNAHAPDYYITNTGFQEINFSGTLGFKKDKTEIELFFAQFKSEIGVLKSSHIHSLTDLFLATQASQPLVEDGFTYQINRPRQEVTHQTYKLKYKYKSNIGILSLSINYQSNNRLEFDRAKPRGKSETEPQLYFELNTASAEATYEHSPTQRWSGIVGVQASHQGNAWDYRFLIPNFISNQIGFFAIEKLQINPKIQLELGLRYDSKNLTSKRNRGGVFTEQPFDFSNLSSTIGLKYSINEKLDWRINFGNSFRTPAANELFINGFHNATGFYERGNLDLKAERGFKFITQLKYSTYKSTISFEPYFHYISNYIYYSPDTQNPVEISFRGPSFIVNYLQNNVNLYGADLQISQDISKSFSAQFKANAIAGWNIEKNDFVPMLPPARGNIQLDYKFKEIDFLKKIKPVFSFGSTIVAKQIWTPTYADTTIALPFINQEIRITNSDFAPIPEAYALFNANLSAEIPFRQSPIIISLSCQNLFNQKYRDYLNRFRYFSDEMGRNFTLRIQLSI